MNEDKKLALRDFLNDLRSDCERPTKETNSYINVLIQKTNNKLQIKLSAEKTSKNIENIEDLTETASEIGKIERVEKIQGDNREDYKIILSITPNEFGTNLIEVLKQKIKQYEELSKNSREILGLTEFDNYLGKWNSRDFILKRNIGKDLNELYCILEDRLDISLEEVCSDSKSKNIPVARAIISLFLRNKYDISFLDIGKILGGKNHATVILGIKKFNRLTLTPEDYENVTNFFYKSIKHYQGRLT